MRKLLDKLFGSNDTDDDRVIRDPEFAGVQYPDDADELRDAVDGHLAAADGSAVRSGVLGLIVPYGDYRYAGPVMGAAYASVDTEASVDRVLVMGPSTRVPFRGLAVAGYEAWGTPVGEVEIDLEVLQEAVETDDVRPIEAAFEPAASLELQMPFVRRRFGDVPAVPVLVGDTDASTVAAFLERFWDDRTLLVVSGNLSRGLPAEEAEALDRETIAAIESGEADALEREATAARTAIQGMVETVGRRGGEVELIEYRTSTEAAGGADQVVGNGAFAVS